MSRHTCPPADEVPDKVLQDLLTAVRDHIASRCHAPSDLPLPDIVRWRKPGETYTCGREAGHPPPHRWPDPPDPIRGPIIEWTDNP